MDPDQLGGSAWTAAITSFLLFAAGAIVPVVPFFFVTGTRAAVASLAAAGVALLVIGAAISLFTRRGVVWSGTRQLLLGFAAAAVTYAIGHALGVAIAGSEARPNTLRARSARPSEASGE